MIPAAIAVQLSMAAYANTQPTEAEIEALKRQMMQGAAQMQSCFANIDQQALQQLQKRGEQLDADVRKLCQAGEGSEAENKAIAFAREMQSDKSLQALRECGEMAKNMIPDLPFADYSEHLPESGDTQYHIYDNYQ